LTLCRLEWNFTVGSGYPYFFTEPRYTFEITRPDEFVAVTLFLVMGLAGGNLANRIRRQVSALQATN
jgi:two-component system sensor histidine kinase KdpD